MPSLANANQRSARDLLASQTIALEASDSNTTFQVHQYLLSSVSPVLLAACSNEWKETTTRHYKFHEDVTESVLSCFLIWAYSGDYHDGNENKIIPLVYEPMEALEQPIEEPKQEEKAKSTGSLVPEDDLHPLLLHIKLYIFADAYMIEPLKTLTKQKIMNQLQKFGSLAEGHERGAVIDGLTYVFSSRLPEHDVLLHWLARYASWRLDELKQMTSSFDKLLLETDGNFARLLVRYVLRSSIDPFALKTEDIVPRYPMPRVR